ncbi:MAG: hypothetical protein V2I24_15900 [Halieaceae bacterium]|jgi:hypothetical protein|nr:hypothetical protein [Halieaceae bacterium]
MGSGLLYLGLRSALILLGVVAPALAMVRSDPEVASTSSAAAMQIVSFRFRTDTAVGLNEDAGWGAPENVVPELHYDRPFRLRLQVRAIAERALGEVAGLQYRRSGEPWRAVGVADFPYPDFATPVVSVVSTEAYAAGAGTEPLLGGADEDESDEGQGLNAVAMTPAWNPLEDEIVEWEWPLVIRRFADGPTFSADGTVFELRAVDGLGYPLAGSSSLQIPVTAAPRHLGGTFVETPGRLGPYQSAQGHLYFFMEPTETDNRLLAMRSVDYGLSWEEVDAEHRPVADDLEGVSSTRVGNTIHLVHQVSEEVFHHAFAIGGDEGEDQWLIDSHSIATHEEPPTQFADIAARSDGSLVVAYAGLEKLFLQSRHADGSWGDAVRVDDDLSPSLSGPVLVAHDNDVITLAYTGFDGSGFVRHLLPDNTLSPRQRLSNKLGVEDEYNGAFLPLVAIPGSGETVVIYQEEDGLLYERRFAADDVLSPPVKVSALPAVHNAVDSEQVGADLVAYEGTLHLLFIEAASRSIYYTRSVVPGEWSEPELVIDGIEGSWVRGSIHRDDQGQLVYGFVYDAGSKGGAGMNRYHSILLGTGAAM